MIFLIIYNQQSILTKLTLNILPFHNWLNKNIIINQFQAINPVHLNTKNNPLLI